MSGGRPGCERLVGNGMAAMRTVEELLSRAPSRYEISVIGAEPSMFFRFMALTLLGA